MRCCFAVIWWLLLGATGGHLLAQVPGGAPTPASGLATPGAEQPLPNPTSLLGDVERNQKRLEGLERDYTYHVHTEEQELDKNGGVKKTQTQEAESLTIDGVRVNRVTARDGRLLTPAEQQKESERIDKEVAKARERRVKVEAKGHDTDERGNEIMPLSRILELGSFSNPHRTVRNGRPVIQLDYAGNPQAKTHSAFESIMRDVVGTLFIDEEDRVLIAAQGHFLSDFKLGGGLLADVRKGTNFSFRATRVAEGVWLPAEMTGQGTVRLLLFASFNGRMHVVTSDYKRFHASATIIGSHGAIDPDGKPLTSPDAAPSGESQRQHTDPGAPASTKPPER